MNKSTTNVPKGRDHTAALLDPYGIYGTRTAHRLRSMRRRRRVQQFILMLLVLGLIVLGIYSWNVHRVTALKLTGSWPLLISPSATPLWDAQYQTLLVPTSDGQLVAVWPSARPVHSQIWLETDFPMRAAPVLGEKYVYAGSENGTLYALARSSGKVAWSYPSGASITTTPQLLGNLIFCGNDDGWVAALRANDGTLVWRRKLPSPIGDGMAATTAPSKMVIAPLPGRVAMLGGVWALDANNGNIKWKFPAGKTGNAEQMTMPVNAVIDGKSQVICANDTGALMSLNAADGKYGKTDGGWKTYLQNKHDANARLMMRQTPLLDPQASRIYVSGNDDVVRGVDLLSGRVEWEWAAPSPVNGNLQLLNGNLLVPCDGLVSYLLNPANGEAAARLISNGDRFATMLGVDQNVWALDASGTLQQFALSNH